ncbi:ABC transporter substrate-binding protein [Petropleomorpha daqingensis]|uniref:Peptide/nickel transport system substrate-binding protein n=1 Tax=Petropleomorpha daqingensis TaxID=2026353 RepID=A0A853CKU7_9ACTN|nr:ABC transporter substrate-binding protein [Petropleomorpha daqingensis]NYJ06868.1 peptide/nickel transport system substrate-binding protein [Petropleomorpha daqingensis]
MDKTTTFDNNSIYVMEQIMEPLFTVSKDGSKVEPWLATGYDVSDDKLTYTIHLREGVTFSNGQPLTAADVKFSIDEDTATGSDGWGYINSAIDTVTATDDNTVTITLKYAWAPLIADLSLFSNGIIPNNYGGQTKDAFYAAPVGTGPFIWDSWKKGQYVKVKANKDYWGHKPHLDSVTWTVVADANTRKLQLQGGQIDIDDTPDWSSFTSLKSAPGINAQTFKSTYMEYVTFNEQRQPFQDPHVRRAIAYALDRDAIIKTVLFGNGTPADSLLSPGTPFYDKDNGAPTFDMDKAKQEMAQSTVPNGFSTTMLISSGDPNQASIAQIMQSELKDLGIDLQIQQLDPTAQKQARLKSDFDLVAQAWTMDIPDPDEWTSFAVDPDGGSHSSFSYYTNPQVIDLNKQAQQETDESKRQDLYSQIQTQVSADSPFAYLYYAPYVFAMTDHVKGFDVTPLGNYHLEDVYKTK